MAKGNFWKAEMLLLDAGPADQAAKSKGSHVEAVSQVDLC